MGKSVGKPKRMFPVPREEGYYFERKPRFFDREDTHSSRLFYLTLCLLAMCAATILVLVSIGAYVWANQLKD